MAKGNSNGVGLGFEDKLWATADKLRGNMEAAKYKHVVLGLIFLKYISDAFMEKFTALQTDDLVVLANGYVGAEEIEDDGVPFEEKMAEMSAQLDEQMAAAEALCAAIRRNLEALGYGE